MPAREIAAIPTGPSPSPRGPSDDGREQKMTGLKWLAVFVVPLPLLAIPWLVDEGAVPLVVYRFAHAPAIAVEFFRDLTLSQSHALVAVYWYVVGTLAAYCVIAPRNRRRAGVFIMIVVLVLVFAVLAMMLDEAERQGAL